MSLSLPLTALKRTIGPFAVAYEWNDAPSRTHAEVIAMFDRAIELA